MEGEKRERKSEREEKREKPKVGRKKERKSEREEKRGGVKLSHDGFRHSSSLTRWTKTQAKEGTLNVYHPGEI